MTCTRRLLVPRDFEQAKAKIHRLELRVTGEAEQPAAPQYLDKSFAEDLWFARGLGLVRLEQAVDGVQSMVWSLQNESLRTGLAGAEKGLAGSIP